MTNRIAALARAHPVLGGCLLLFAITVVNNWPVSYFGFAWDDIGYVVRNYPIQDPVSLKTLWWCLTKFAEANWHPLTWFALNIQFNVFGLDPRGYHIVNLALHVANVLLLYAFLWRTTGAAGKSLVVAALFAVHPLHVESVAWISEIKDVFSTLFFLLALHAHVGHARKPGAGRLALVLFWLALGLMAKPMLVTAPCAMLLLDVWPLGRWKRGPAAARPDRPCPRLGLWRLFFEKLPMFLLVAATCLLTFLAQRDGGAMAGLDALPLASRLANAANSYVLYLWRMVWPWPLSFFYPMSAHLPAWRVAGCVLALAAITGLCLRAWTKKPYLLTGWLWFLGTLVPVIGIIQVGSQALADRYTYIPSIGLLVAGVWLASDSFRRFGLSWLLPSVLAGATIFTAMLVSFEYLGHWATEEELYTHGLAVDENNTVALNNLANIESGRQNSERSKELYRKNLSLTPGSALALNNLAMVLWREGDVDEAQKTIETAIRHNPSFAGSYVNLALVKASQLLTREAETLLLTALSIDPKNVAALSMLANVLYDLREDDKALSVIGHGLAAVFDKDPARLTLLNRRGLLELRRKRYPEAAATFRLILTQAPDHHPARKNLARAQSLMGDPGEAEKNLRRVLAATPRDPEALYALGRLQASGGRRLRAMTQYRRALAVAPGFVDAHLELAGLERALGLADAADIHLAQAHEWRTFRGVVPPRPPRPETASAGR